MAMGLSLSGRRSQQTKVVLAHLAGAAAGGAAFGYLLGLIGQAVLTGAARLVVLICFALYALYLAAQPRKQIGFHRQVPRRWLGRWSAGPTYAAWGALLGLGVATVIPYSAYLVLMSGELIAGPALAALVGAVFGLTREAVTLVPLAAGAAPPEISGTLPRFVKSTAVLNVAVIIGATSLLAVRL